MKSALEVRKLLYGPYHPPRVRRGDVTFCELRGTVKVGGYSDGPIPWPVKWQSKSIILCGDLIRAVNMESEKAVAFHWGVCYQTVWKWRKALGTQKMNPGTVNVFRTLFHQKMEPATGRLIAYLGRSPEVAKRVVRNLLACALPGGFHRPLTGLLRRPTSRRCKRQLLAAIRKHGWPDNARLMVLNDTEIGLLGTESDGRLSKKLGVRTGVVQAARQKHKPDLEAGHRPWTIEQDGLVGTAPDAEIAKQLGRTEASVKRRRGQLRRLKREIARWNKRELELLGNKSNAEMVALTGRTVESIKKKRWRIFGVVDRSSGATPS